MKKLIYISFIFAFVLAFASCEKELIEPMTIEDDVSSDRNNFDDPGTRGGEDGGKDDVIVDPDEDEDFDEDEDDVIVDPDEDEDFDEEEKGD